MAIVKTGDFYETLADGDVGFGINSAGSLTVNGGSSYTVDDPDNSFNDTFFQLGSNASGDGTALITGANSKLILNGSGHDGPTVRVANLGTGSLTVSNGGSLIINETVNSGDTYSSVVVARRAGTGTMTVDHGTLSVTGPGANMQIARENGDGTVEIRNGSTATFTSTANGLSADLGIGRQGGTGKLIVDNSSLSFIADHGFAGMNIGAGNPSAGTGTVILRNGATLSFSGQDAHVNVGSRAGAAGTLQVLSGSSLTISATSANGGGMGIGEVDGGFHASVEVTGPGSTLNAGRFLVVGANGYDSVEFGNGVLTIGDGGLVIVDDANIGHGGTLFGGNARMQMTNNLDIIDGTLVLTSGGGQFELTDGTYVDQGGTLKVEVASNGATAGHLFVSGGDLAIGADARITISPLGGYKFAAGQAFDIATWAAGSHLDLDEAIPFDHISVLGQNAQFGFAVGEINQALKFQALNSGSGAGVAAFHFGDASTAGASIEYDVDSGWGLGHGGDFERVFVHNADQILGTAAADSLHVVGATAGITLQGFGGNDQLLGGGGLDTLLGGTGADTLIGGLGNDDLDGGSNPEVGSPGAQGDVMLGGDGNDTYHVDSGLDLVDEDGYFPGYGNGGTDTIISTTDFYWDIASVGEIDQVAENVFDAGGDGVTIVGGVFNNTLLGHTGTDVLFGRGGSDTYRAGDGVDFISLSTLGVTDAANYTADGNNIIVVDPRATGAFSYDIVFEFDPTKDKIDVSHYIGAHDYTSAAQVLSNAVDDGFGNSYIVLGDGLDYLYMVGLEKADLLESDFVV